MKAVEQTECTQDPKKILCAHTSVASLKTAQGVARDTGTVGGLSLSQTPQSAPSGNVIRDLA